MYLILRHHFCCFGQQAYQNQGSPPPNYARTAAVKGEPETESGNTDEWEPETNEGSLLLA